MYRLIEWRKPVANKIKNTGTTIRSLELAMKIRLPISTRGTQVHKKKTEYDRKDDSWRDSDKDVER